VVHYSIQTVAVLGAGPWDASRTCLPGGLAYFARCEERFCTADGTITKNLDREVRRQARERISPLCSRTEPGDRFAGHAAADFVSRPCGENQIQRAVLRNRQSAGPSDLDEQHFLDIDPTLPDYQRPRALCGHHS